MVVTYVSMTSAQDKLPTGSKGIEPTSPEIDRRMMSHKPKKSHDSRPHTQNTQTTYHIANHQKMMTNFSFVLTWLTTTIVMLTHAFVPHSPHVRPGFLFKAGGFEWEDPVEAFDQGVENPFKNPELMNTEQEGLKIDPARLLAPRLHGSNLYFIGMMGSGKTAVGDIVARREYNAIATILFCDAVPFGEGQLTFFLHYSSRNGHLQLS